MSILNPPCGKLSRSGLYVSGFKYREIADRLDLPLGTVKSRIHFTRRRLQEELKDFR